MGILSRTKSKQTKLTYKKLYEIELHNRKMYEERYKQIEQQYRDLQKEKGVGELRKKIMELADKVEELTPLKEENTKLKLEIEDLNGFLLQEKQAKEHLLKERNKK